MGNIITPYSERQQSQSQANKGTTFSLTDLLRTDFPEIGWLVDGMLPEGFVVLAGRPKSGKSILALQLAGAVASGRPFLGRKTQTGKVLYYALEDSGRRLKQRVLKQGITANSPILFELALKRDYDRLVDEIEETIKGGGISMVVIDTLTRALGGVDQMELGEMSDIYGGLQELAMVNNLTILGIDHHRKQIGFTANPIDDLIGSTGKSAPIDTVLGLYRKRGESNSTLMISGRDVDEQDHTLALDRQTLLWMSVAEGMVYDTNSRKGKILDAIKALNSAGQPATPTHISVTTGVDMSNVSHDLAELEAAGAVAKGEKIGIQQPYFIPEVTPIG